MKPLILAAWHDGVAQKRSGKCWSDTARADSRRASTAGKPDWCSVRWGATCGETAELSVESPAEPAAGFALVLRNGRRIESAWGYGEAALARLIRIAEGA